MNHVYLLIDDNGHHPVVLSAHSSEQAAEHARIQEFEARFRDYAEHLRSDFAKHKASEPPTMPEVKYESQPSLTDSTEEEWDDYLDYMETSRYEDDYRALQDYRHDLHEWERKERMYEGVKDAIDRMLDRLSESLEYDLYVRKYAVQD